MEVGLPSFLGSSDFDNIYIYTYIHIYIYTYIHIYIYTYTSYTVFWNTRNQEFEEERAGQ